MKTWPEIRAAVLSREPKAGPLLDVISKYWGDGQLTEDVASKFIAAMASRQFAQAQRLLYASMDATALLEADRAENKRLEAIVAAETKLYNFLGDLEAALLKVALGVALAAVGL